MAPEKIDTKTMEVDGENTEATETINRADDLEMEVKRQHSDATNGITNNHLMRDHNHGSTHPNDVIPNFACDECPNTYTHRRQLLAHKRTEHSESQFQCQKCLKVVSAKRYLKDHKCCPDPRNTKIKCPVCSAYFLTDELLNAHMTLRHSAEETSHEPQEEGCHSANVRSFDCQLCHDTFESVEELRQHLDGHLVDCEDDGTSNENGETTDQTEQIQQGSSEARVPEQTPPPSGMVGESKRNTVDTTDTIKANRDDSNKQQTGQPPPKSSPSSAVLGEVEPNEQIEREEKDGVGDESGELQANRDDTNEEQCGQLDLRKYCAACDITFKRKSEKRLHVCAAIEREEKDGVGDESGELQANRDDTFKRKSEKRLHVCAAIVREEEDGVADESGELQANRDDTNEEQCG